MPKMMVTDRMFMEELQNAKHAGKCLKHVSDVLGVGHQAVVARYKGWQKKGINVPELPHNLTAGPKGRRIDVEAMNKLAAELSAKFAEQASETPETVEKTDSKSKKKVA